ncbi:metalloregulator ArsR/SmtB family transcription factor [bacterium]|nr:metalloregulator ArsR/SmtB family transcription factor [bacterium]
MDVNLFKAISDPNRLTILLQLMKCCRACSVTELSDCCPVDFSVISRHLAILRDAGIVNAEKRGKYTFYTINYDPLLNNLRELVSMLEDWKTQCCPPGNKDK